MNPNDVVLTGVPRSGTTLSCHLLNTLPNSVALHEPLPARNLAGAGDRSGAVAEVVKFFEENRRSALDAGRVFTKHREGEVPMNGVIRKAGESVGTPTYERSFIAIDKPLQPDFLLVVKHPSSFAALLDLLTPKFRAYAVIRNPLSVLCSWNTVEMAVRNGHAPAAERFAPELVARLKAAPDATSRQLLLLSWFYERFAALLPDENILRYEQLVASQGRSLRIIDPAAESLAEPLRSRNRSPDYPEEAMRRLADRLLASEGAYWRFYSREEVAAVVAEPV